MQFKWLIFYTTFWVSLHFGFAASAQDEVWQMQDTGVKASLRGLCVVNDSTVWCSGTGGTVIRTEDAGQSWENVSIGEAGKLDFRDIHAFDKKRAVVVSAGQPARIYKTIDAGKTWKMTFEHGNEKTFFDAMSFFDAKHGIAMSDPIDGHVLLVATTDGGDSWIEVDAANRPQVERGEAGFAASGTNMIVLGDKCLIALGSGETGQSEPSSRIVYSNDRGKTWQHTSVPMPRNPSSGIFSLAIDATSGFGVAVGGDYLQPEKTDDVWALTVDHGRTWKKPAGRSPLGFRSAVAFVTSESKKLVAVGTNGTDISTDAGQNWKKVSDTGFHTLAFTSNGSSGWASGSDGRVGKWTQQ